MNDRFLNKTKGFSLVEILVVVSIFLLLFNAIWLIYSKSVKTSETLSTSLNSQQETRRAFTTMTSGIRSAATSNIGAYPIAAASSTGLIYYSDIDSDGLREQIRYFMVGTSLRQGVIKPTGNPLVYQASNERVTTLVHYVINDASRPVFSFYDGTYSGTEASLAEPIAIQNVRLIKIDLLIDKDPTKSPGAISFTTQVVIRNLKDNL
jgi:prepilin-type N-terminal cleavage/methylation domain-containing protein